MGGFKVGQRVNARWKGGNYFPGKITKHNEDGSFAVQFDDGDFDAAINPGHIQAENGNEKRSLAQRKAKDLETTRKQLLSSMQNKIANPNAVKQIIGMMERAFNQTGGSEGNKK